MRKAFIGAMVVLVVVALFAGNCLSCPQMLLASQQPAHSCCHKPQPTSARCQTQGMQHFVKADVSAPSVPLVAELVELPAPVFFAPEWISSPLPAADSSPGPLTLTFSLRI